MSSALVVYSGGLDSYTLLNKALQNFKKVEAITFDYGQKHKKEIEDAVISLNITQSNIELIDKSILYFAINEMLFGELDKPVAIYESLRLSKKFSSPDSYKFINAGLDKFLKSI